MAYFVLLKFVYTCFEWGEVEVVRYGGDAQPCVLLGAVFVGFFPILFPFCLDEKQVELPKLAESS